MNHPADAYPYAYLLGAYLGDGHVADAGRRFQPRITLDGRHPRIIDECAGAMILSLPSVHPRIRCDRTERRMNVDAGSKHWPDLFPQMGPGRKHERPIVLAPWQREIVDRHPWPFVRGLIHSDGCRTVSRFKTRLPSGRVARYAYPRYFFSNLSRTSAGCSARAASGSGCAGRSPTTATSRSRIAQASPWLDEHVGTKC